MILSNRWNGSDLLLHWHELDPPETRTIEEQDAEFLVDYDQHKSNANLINNEESNRDLNSRTVITSNLSIKRSFETASTIDGINEQKTILNSKSNKISLISDHINHRSIAERESIDRVHFFSSIYIYHFEDEFKPIEKVSNGMIIQCSSSTIISCLVRDINRYLKFLSILPSLFKVDIKIILLLREQLTY
jgi:hypothetical protein